MYDVVPSSSQRISTKLIDPREEIPSLSDDLNNYPDSRQSLSRPIPDLDVREPIEKHVYEPISQFSSISRIPQQTQDYFDGDYLAEINASSNHDFKISEDKVDFSSAMHKNLSRSSESRNTSNPVLSRSYSCLADTRKKVYKAFSGAKKFFKYKNFE